MRILVSGALQRRDVPPRSAANFFANAAEERVAKLDQQGRPVDFTVGPLGTSAHRVGSPLALPDWLSRVRSTRQVRLLLDSCDMSTDAHENLTFAFRPRNAKDMDAAGRLSALPGVMASDIVLSDVELPGRSDWDGVEYLFNCGAVQCGAVQGGAGGSGAGGSGAGGCGAVGCGAVGGGSTGSGAGGSGTGGCGAAGCGAVGCGAVACGAAGKGGGGCGAAACGAVGCAAAGCGAVACAAAGCVAAGCAAAACGAATAACAAAACGLDSACGANAGWPP